MEISEITDAIQCIDTGYSKNQLKKLLYIADTSNNICSQCKNNDGKIFNIDDPDLPQLPIHPHCRCRYVSAENPSKNITVDVERYQIIQNIKKTNSTKEADAASLADQVINARYENQTLREQKLFLIFNGNYLMSSDGKLLLEAASGEPIFERTIINSDSTSDMMSKTIEREFDYSYSRQGKKNIGGIPQGLYHIEEDEERSATTSPWSHIVKSKAWGNYSWSLHPEKETDVRNRNGFFIHGGTDFGSGGCIDLQKNDTVFQEYFNSTKMSSIYVYVKYKNEKVLTKEKKFQGYTTIPYLR